MILAFNVSSYLVQSRMRNLTDQARFLAQTVQLEAQRDDHAEALAETLERRQSSTETRYPFRVGRHRAGLELTCKVAPAQAARVPRNLPARAAR